MLKSRLEDAETVNRVLGDYYKSQEDARTYAQLPCYADFQGFDLSAETELVEISHISRIVSHRAELRNIIKWDYTYSGGTSPKIREMGKLYDRWILRKCVFCSGVKVQISRNYTELAEMNFPTLWIARLFSIYEALFRDFRTVSLQARKRSANFGNAP